jgi:ATP-dependent DNA helicase RecQ
MPASVKTPEKTAVKSEKPQTLGRKTQRRPQVRAVPWNGLHAEAKERFGIDRFRPGQREALEAIFCGHSVVALMPTGSGKSLCYQLPSIFLPNPVVVVSPLIALMRDQQEKAEDAEIAVEKVDSTLSRTESGEVIEAIESGISQLIYVTPERLENGAFLDMLAERRVSLLAVDEAHCISQWGHDFRPAYLNLRYARQRMGDPPVIALTATATEAVLDDIRKHLGIEDAAVINTGTERENLEFSVRMAVNSANKREWLLKLLKEEEGTGIVYTASIHSANELQEWLTANGISAGRYHAKLKRSEREAVQQKFMRGEYKVLFATKAFGLGIDKPDIRFVYHYEFPDSLETYYQEAGRAGRDGKPARAVLLYRLEDRRIQRFFLLSRYPKLEECRRVLEAVGEAAGVSEIAQRADLPRRRTQVILHLLRESGFIRRSRRGYAHKVKPVGEEELAQVHATFDERGKQDRGRLDEMMHYAESGRCRKQILRTYFGEDEGEPCGACDNCTRVVEAKVVPIYASQPVTEVETAIGTIVTTAPETLPQKERESRFKPGDLVRHLRFGSGTVLDADGRDLMVRFDEGKTRKIRSTYVRPLAKTA